MKKCTKCGAEKSKSEFYIRKANRDGLEGQCKCCAKRKGEAW